jgi:hypothetical protein
MLDLAYIDGEKRVAGDGQQVRLEHGITHSSQDEGEIIRGRLEGNPSKNTNLRY